TGSVGSPAFQRAYRACQTAPSRALEKSSSVMCSLAHRIADLSARDAPMTARSAASVAVASTASNIFHPFLLRWSPSALRVGGEVVVPLLGAEPCRGVWDVLKIGPGCLDVRPVRGRLGHEVVVTDLLRDSSRVCHLRVAPRGLLLPDAPPLAGVLHNWDCHSRTAQ